MNFSEYHLCIAHVPQIFTSRQDFDRVQEQIDNIKGRAWDPKRNLPYW